MAKQEKSAAEQYRAKRKARLAKAAKRNKKRPISPEASKRIAKAIGIVAVVAIVAVIVGFVLNYTGLIQRNTTAMTLADGTKISQSEYGFHAASNFNQVLQYSSYVSYDTTQTPDMQEYTGSMIFGAIKDFPEDQTPTWADFIEYSAKQSISTLKSAVAAAKELGIELDDDDYAEIDSSIDSLKASAAQNNYSLSAFLRANYGKGVNVKLYRQILGEQTLASKLFSQKTDEAKAAVTAKQVEKAYKDGIAQYGEVSYRAYTVTAEALPVEKDDAADAETADADASADTATDAEAEPATATTKATRAAAKATANDIAASTTEKEYVKKVTAAAKAAKTEDFDITSTLHEDATADAIEDTEFSAWAYGKDAVKGATLVTGGDESYTVYMITEPVHKPSGGVSSYSVRHILVKFPGKNTDAATEETADAAETKDDAKNDVEITALDTAKAGDLVLALDATPENASDKATYQKAQDILQEYINGEHTADAFGALAKKYTEDSNGDQGGLYSDVPLGQMVAPFESWAIADGRKEGDVGIVETTYGYHVMYFVSSESKTWDDQIRSDLVSEDMNNYQTSVAENEDFAPAEINEKATTAVLEMILKMARTQIRNSANSASSY